MKVKLPESISTLEFIEEAKAHCENLKSLIDLNQEWIKKYESGELKLENDFFLLTYKANTEYHTKCIETRKLQNELKKKEEQISIHQDKYDYDLTKYNMLEKKFKSEGEAIITKINELLAHKDTPPSIKRFFEANLRKIKTSSYKDVVLDTFESIVNFYAKAIGPRKVQ